MGVPLYYGFDDQRDTDLRPVFEFSIRHFDLLGCDVVFRAIIPWEFQSRLRFTDAGTDEF